MEAQDVLCRVFRPDPVTRISLGQLGKHPWLTGVASELHPGALMPLASSLHLERLQDPTPVMLSPIIPSHPQLPHLGARVQHRRVSCCCSCCYWHARIVQCVVHAKTKHNLVVQQIIDCTCGTVCGGPAPADGGGHQRGHSQSAPAQAAALLHAHQSAAKQCPRV